MEHRRESYDEIENNDSTIRDDKILVRWRNIEVKTPSDIITCYCQCYHTTSIKSIQSRLLLYWSMEYIIILVLFHSDVKNKNGECKIFTSLILKQS